MLHNQHPSFTTLNELSTEPVEAPLEPPCLARGEVSQHQTTVTADVVVVADDLGKTSVSQAQYNNHARLHAKKKNPKKNDKKR